MPPAARVAFTPLTAAPRGGGSGGLLVELAPWLVALVAVIAVGSLVVHLIRRRIAATAAPDEGFTLDDLRRLHAAGELDDGEFARAKAALIARVRGSATPDPPRPDDPQNR